MSERSIDLEKSAFEVQADPQNKQLVSSPGGAQPSKLVEQSRDGVVLEASAYSVRWDKPARALAFGIGGAQPSEEQARLKARLEEISYYLRRLDFPGDGDDALVSGYLHELAGLGQMGLCVFALGNGKHTTPDAKRANLELDSLIGRIQGDFAWRLAAKARRRALGTGVSLLLPVLVAAFVLRHLDIGAVLTHVGLSDRYLWIDDVPYVAKVCFVILGCITGVMVTFSLAKAKSGWKAILDDRALVASRISLFAVPVLISVVALFLGGANVIEVQVGGEAVNGFETTDLMGFVFGFVVGTSHETVAALVLSKARTPGSGSRTEPPPRTPSEPPAAAGGKSDTASNS